MHFCYYCAILYFEHCFIVHVSFFLRSPDFGFRLKVIRLSSHGGSFKTPVILPATAIGPETAENRAKTLLIVSQR